MLAICSSKVQQTSISPKLHHHVVVYRQFSTSETSNKVNLSNWIGSLRFNNYEQAMNQFLRYAVPKSEMGHGWTIKQTQQIHLKEALHEWRNKNQSLTNPSRKSLNSKDPKLMRRYINVILDYVPVESGFKVFDEKTLFSSDKIRSFERNDHKDIDKYLTKKVRNISRQQNKSLEILNKYKKKKC